MAGVAFGLPAPPPGLALRSRSLAQAPPAPTQTAPAWSTAVRWHRSTGIGPSCSLVPQCGARAISRVVAACAAAWACATLLRPRRRCAVHSALGWRSRGSRTVCAAAAVNGGVATSTAGESASADSDSKVVLLGDSVLDNFIWLNAPERHLRVELEERLQEETSAASGPGKPRRVVSLAVDQTSTFDFEERTAQKNPWQMFADARQRVSFVDESDRVYSAVDSDGVLRQPKALARLQNVSWAVLSVGGNDVYLSRDVQLQLVSSIFPPFASKREDVAEAFGQRLRSNIRAIKKASPSATLVLVIPYHPHKDFSLLIGAPIDDEGNLVQGDVLGNALRSLERNTLSDLVTPLVREILAVAREQKCPVIDLSKTFDTECEEHYGTGRIGKKNSLGVPWSGAEPSDVSSAFIAQLIVHAISSEPKAMVYRGVPQRGPVAGDPWSLNIFEDVNDFMFAESYRFGHFRGDSGKSAVKNDGGAFGKDISGWGWFGIGAVIALVGNIAALFIKL